MDPASAAGATPAAFAALWSRTPAAARPALARERARTDLSFFARYFLPSVCRLPWSPLHRWLMRRRLEKTALPAPGRRGAIDIVLAPRGAAKSSLLSLVFPIHSLLHRTDPYIVILSATDRQAAERLANIRAALDGSPRLAESYGAELRSRERASRRSILINGVRVDAFSAGSEIRGVTHGGWRPCWIVLDDVESGGRVESTAYRDRLAAWMTEVVENLGNGYTNIDLAGTLLHPDALPARLARRPDARVKTFRSILAEAEDAALWARWRSLLFDLADPDRLATARRFFEERRDAMLRGAKALWPAKEDYYSLRLMREVRGEAAFNKEKQNEPPPEGSGLFAMSRAARFKVSGDALEIRPSPGGEAGPGPRVPLAGLRVAGFLDPALGGGAAKRNGDYAAIVTAGIDLHGYIYILDVWMERAGPSEQIAKAFELRERWRHADFGVESNAFQEVLVKTMESERDRRRRAGQPWMLPVRGVKHSKAKSLRIAAMEPPVRQGWVLFADDLPEEFERQMADYPRGRHDDGPDALAAVAELLRSGGAAPAGEIGRAARGAGMGRY